MSIFDTNTLLLLHCDNFTDTYNNYTLINNGITISNEGKFGNCFNINQSYITLNKSIELNCNTGFTIDFWINPSQFDSQYQYHLSSGLNFISYDKDRVYCSMCGIDKDSFYTDEPLTLNEFTHVAIVGENNVIKMFINGILKAYKDAINTTQVFDVDNKFFMYQSGATAHNPVCKIDEFRISNIARWQTDFEVPIKKYELVTVEKLSNESALIDVNDRNELLSQGLCDLKDRLENNLNSLGVTDLDNNSMLSLVDRVKKLAIGKKWATGTLSENITHLDSNLNVFKTHRVNFNFGFVPSLIFIIPKSFKSGATTLKPNIAITNLISYDSENTTQIANYSANHYMYVYIDNLNSTGFDICYRASSSASFSINKVTWYAFE